MSATFNLKRNEIIELCYRNINVIGRGQSLNAPQLEDGITAIALIIREMDDTAEHRWTTTDVSNRLYLKADTFSFGAGTHVTNGGKYYVCSQDHTSGDLADEPGVGAVWEQFWNETLESTATAWVTTTAYSGGINRDIQKLINVMYITSTASTQLDIVDVIAYERDIDQGSVGAPVKVYLTNKKTFSDKTLFFNKMLSSVSGEYIRYVFQRPIEDFADANANPDIPLSWVNEIVMKLTALLAAMYGMSAGTHDVFEQKARDSLAVLNIAQLSDAEKKRIVRT